MPVALKAQLVGMQFQRAVGSAGGPVGDLRKGARGLDVTDALGTVR